MRCTAFRAVPVLAGALALAGTLMLAAGSERAAVRAQALPIAGPDCAQPAEVCVCSGSPTGVYFPIAELLVQRMPTMAFGAGQLHFHNVPTGGSVENLHRAVQGECDFFIVQAGVDDYYARVLNTAVTVNDFHVVAPLHEEIAVFLWSRRGNVDSIRDLRGRPAKIATGGIESGSTAMLGLLKAIDDRYAGLDAYPAGGLEGARAVADGQADGMLLVIAPNALVLRQIEENHGDALVFTRFNEPKLEEYRLRGQPVFQIKEWDDDDFAMARRYSDPEVASGRAKLMVTTRFYTANRAFVDQIGNGVRQMQTQIDEIAFAGIRVR